MFGKRKCIPSKARAAGTSQMEVEHAAAFGVKSMTPTSTTRQITIGPEETWVPGAEVPGVATTSGNRWTRITAASTCGRHGSEKRLYKTRGPMPSRKLGAGVAGPQ